MRWTEEALRVILACAVFLGGCGLILLLPVHDRKLPAIFGLPALFFAGWKILHPDAPRNELVKCYAIGVLVVAIASSFW